MTRATRWGPVGRRIAVVVPTWNEAERIDRRVRALLELDVVGVWVVDGGSPDGTADRAARAGATVLHCERGRGQQLAMGGRAAEGDVLWFVHADVRVPPDGPARIREALADDTVVGGAFRIRTVDDVSGRWRTALRIADWRAALTKLPYGDQALFARKDAFQAVGGFPRQRLFEDLEMSKRLWTVGRMVVLRGPVEVSGRRFLARPLKSVVAMNVLPWAYHLGIDPATLEAWYGAHR